MRELLNIKAYAKINLGLDVIRRRKDGYHDLDMIMQTVDLYDDITLKSIDEKKIILSSSGIEVPVDETNLAYRAAKKILEEAGIEKGVEIDLIKNIPVAAGLAGGSADAAAVLRGINRLYKLNYTREQLQGIAKDLGADIPYCIVGGTYRARGIGEKLEKLPKLEDAVVLLVTPQISVSTKEVYENLELGRLEERYIPNIEKIVKAIYYKNYDQIGKYMGNILESYTEKKYPLIADIKSAMRKDGAKGSMMSGSGPSVFGIFTDKNKARNCYEAFKNNEYGELSRQVYLCELHN